MGNDVHSLIEVMIRSLASQLEVGMSNILRGLDDALHVAWVVGTAGVHNVIGHSSYCQRKWSLI